MAAAVGPVMRSGMRRSRTSIQQIAAPIASSTVSRAIWSGPGSPGSVSRSVPQALTTADAALRISSIMRFPR